MGQNYTDFSVIYTDLATLALNNQTDFGEMPSRVGDKVKWRSSAIDPYHLMFADVLFHKVDVLGSLTFQECGTDEVGIKKSLLDYFMN